MRHVHGDKDVFWLAAGRFKQTLGISPMNFGIFGDKCVRKSFECSGFPLHYILQDGKYVPFGINSMKYPAWWGPRLRFTTYPTATIAGNWTRKKDYTAPCHCEKIRAATKQQLNVIQKWLNIKVHPVKNLSEF